MIPDLNLRSYLWFCKRQAMGPLVPVGGCIRDFSWHWYNGITIFHKMVDLFTWYIPIQFWFGHNFSHSIVFQILKTRGQESMCSHRPSQTCDFLWYWCQRVIIFLVGHFQFITCGSGAAPLPHSVNLQISQSVSQIAIQPLNQLVDYRRRVWGIMP